MAGSYDFMVEQCAQFARTLTWKKCGGAPYDLTGWSAFMQVRDRPGGSLLTTVPVTLGPEPGRITLNLSSVQTCALAATCGVYQLVLTGPDGENHVLLQGGFTVRAAISRRVSP